MTRFIQSSLVLIVLVATAALVVSATSTNRATARPGDLVRKALHSGLPWTHYLGSMTKREVAAALDSDTCEPGRTCKGLVVQLFFSDSCTWSQTFGFMEVYSDRRYGNTTFNKCHATSRPSMGLLQTCDKESNFKRQLFENSDCTGTFFYERTYKIETCLSTSHNAPATIYWCDAMDAKPMFPNPRPPVDKSAPKLPASYSSCTSTPASPPSAGGPVEAPSYAEQCDPRYGIERTYANSDSKPNCPAPTSNGDSDYIFGKGESRTCYQKEDLNVFMTTDKASNSYTINYIQGCDMTQTPLMSNTRRFGCTWLPDVEQASHFVRAGTSQN